MSMSCPLCGSINNKVIDSRNNDKKDGIVRRRQCLRCGNRWSTTELYSDAILKKKESYPSRPSYKDIKKNKSYKKSVIRNLNTYRSQAIEAAKGLCYDSSVIEKLSAARTSIEISQIMATARKEKFG